jgi:hypothetical protein
LVDVQIVDGVEAAASIVSPLSVAVIAEVLDVSESEVVDAVEVLEASERATSSRQGVTAHSSAVSAARLTHIAGRLADALASRDAPTGQVGRARWAAGEARAAHDAFVTALEDDSTPPEDRFDLIGLAIESGREARVGTGTIAPLLVRRARMLRSRGEDDRATADIEAATPGLQGEPLVDAYGFAAALLDDRQRPSDAERTIAMALQVAAREGLLAKLGSLLTFQGRLLARLGFDAETERVFERGTELVEAHGDAVQRHYATINRAWTDLDRGWVARAEGRYAAARGRGTLDDPVALAELDIAIARAKFGTGDATGAVALLEDVDRIAADTGALALQFLATLARAEGAITFRQPLAAVEAAAALRDIVDESFPAWRNRAATVQARALLLARRITEAREVIRHGFESTPRGANGLRLRTELEALQLMAAERWDEERATDVADRLLQGGWMLAAVALLTERSRREKRPELGTAAAALAHRLGAVPAAAEAIEAAGAWGEPVSGPVALAIRRVAQTVPAEWEESWLQEPAVRHALAAETDEETATDTDLLAHLDKALADAGLAGTETVLSPAQRRAAGLVRSGSAVLSMGRFIAWIAAAAVVAAVVAIAVRPDPVEVPVAAPTTIAVTTTTIPPLLERIVEAPADLGGQAPFAGGDSRNAVFGAELGEPTGIYWSGTTTGFIRSEPVLRGRGLYLGDSEGWVYGLDLLQRGGTVFESRMAGAIDVSPTVEQVDFGQDAQGKVLAFGGDDRGNLLVRHVNDTEGEVFTRNLGSPISGPPLVRAVSLIVATQEGVLYDLLPSDGTELRRFPEEGTVEGGFEGPLAAADGVIYARTGEGAVIVIDEATFTEICTVFSPAARATTHPVVAEGRWYVGTSARSVRVFGVGGCSDSAVGSLQIDTPVAFAPVVVDDVLWAVADAVLLPLDVTTGQSIGFVVSVGGAFTAPPLIAGDLVLVPVESGELVAVSRTDGSELWRVALGAPIRTRPVVANDLVLVATARGDLIALAAPAS